MNKVYRHRCLYAFGTVITRYDLAASEAEAAEQEARQYLVRHRIIEVVVRPTIGGSRGSLRPRSSPECQQKQYQVRCPPECPGEAVSGSDAMGRHHFVIIIAAIILTAFAAVGLAMLPWKIYALRTTASASHTPLMVADGPPSTGGVEKALLGVAGQSSLISRAGNTGFWVMFNDLLGASASDSNSRTGCAYSLTSADSGRHS